MDTYRYLVFAHLFLGVLLAGQALFWLTMLAALRQRFDPSKTASLLQIVRSSRWPHVAVPYRLRLPLPWVMALTLLALILSGVGIVHLRGRAPVGVGWDLKWILILAETVMVAALARWPRPAIIRLGFVLVLAIIVTSAVIIR